MRTLGGGDDPEEKVIRACTPLLWRIVEVTVSPPNRVAEAQEMLGKVIAVHAYNVDECLFKFWMRGKNR